MLSLKNIESINKGVHYGGSNSIPSRRSPAISIFPFLI